MNELFPESASARDSLITDPTPEKLRNFFKARIKEWRQPIFSGECFTVGTFTDLTTRLETSTAFALIPAGLEILMEWDGSEISQTALALLCDLADASATTELPVTLSTHWKDLEVFVEKNNLGDSVFWQSLQSRYRKLPNKPFETTGDSAPS